MLRFAVGVFIKTGFYGAKHIQIALNVKYYIHILNSVTHFEIAETLHGCTLIRKNILVKTNNKSPNFVQIIFELCNKEYSKKYSALRLYLIYFLWHGGGHIIILSLIFATKPELPYLLKCCFSHNGILRSLDFEKAVYPFFFPLQIYFAINVACMGNVVTG